LASYREPSVSTLSGNLQSPLLITCEHAGNTIPADLNQLGLDAATRDTHIAIDIGAVALAANVRDRLHACLIAAEFSRLVVDLNRYPDDPSVILPVSDNVAVPGNDDLDEQQRRSRIDRFHTPYHDAVTKTLNEMQARHDAVFIVFMHSFTPTMDGVQRPWDIGLLFHDEGVAAHLAASVLSETTDMCVGYNEPYTAFEPKSYALYQHAVARGLRYLTIEVRQDLLGHSTAIEKMGQVLAPAIQAAFDFDSDMYSKS